MDVSNSGLAALLVQRRLADGLLAAWLGRQRARLSPLEHRDNLAIGKTGFFHGTSSGKRTKKFHFSVSANLRRDYPPTAGCRELNSQYPVRTKVV